MAKTKRINLSLPEKLADYVQGQVESGHFQREADFIRHAIRKMQESESAANEFDLDAFIQAGVDSGRSKNSGTQIHENARARIHQVGKSRASK
ncbi:ribbon-helix-helix domain-containing protein [Granulosicoccus sp. 3-233]|uniref:ribbon-helix-helix domain-containing protein n=1 Tax=Granulosicoccus sp. 3-233 TaxID=3417969 RepID=UPI003D3302D5